MFIDRMHVMAFSSTSIEVKKGEEDEDEDRGKRPNLEKMEIGED